MNQLYVATAKHFRDIRVVEIEKMEQRTGTVNRRLNIHDLAADIWDAAELEEAMPLREWLNNRPDAELDIVIPEERPALLSDIPLLAQDTVFFGKERKISLDFSSQEQAVLVTKIANWGAIGAVRLPNSAIACSKLLEEAEARLRRAHSRFDELAKSRTGDERTQVQLMDLLERWYLLGREASKLPRPKKQKRNLSICLTESGHPCDPRNLAERLKPCPVQAHAENGCRMISRPICLRPSSRV